MSITTVVVGVVLCLPKSSSLAIRVVVIKALVSEDCEKLRDEIRNPKPTPP
jgi:hypothetical protein